VFFKGMGYTPRPSEKSLVKMPCAWLLAENGRF
jgi:hypothetical protein